MEESSCALDNGASVEETMYLNKQGKGHVGGEHSPYLDRHAVLPLSTCTPICAQETTELEDLKVGSYYEIDHSKLSSKSPEQLKSVRVVMVREKTVFKVSLRYPSIHSLLSHYREKKGGEPDGKNMPALNEKYVMPSDLAYQVLQRRIPTEEFVQKRMQWDFWAVHPLKANRNSSPPFNSGDRNLVSKKGPCLSQLKLTGMVQWGKKRQVRFLGRHKGTEKENMEYDEKEEEKEEGEMEDEEKDARVEPSKNRTCKMKRKNNELCTIQYTKKLRSGKQKQTIPYGRNKKKFQKTSIDRWSAERYKIAEENILKVLKAKGAVFGNPILRPDLRSEARKLIGDTGLLDHLLKHMAGKVAPGGAERFRRRHNAEGAMEYWLERADLVNIRKEAGVQDPYWTPPPGWKPGDNPSQDPICAREIRQIKEEIAKLKQDIQQLVVKDQEGKLDVRTSNSCASSITLDSGCSLILLKEMYLELVNKKAKIEEQLLKISDTMKEMEAQLEMLGPRVTEMIMSESVAPGLLTGPVIAIASTKCETEGQKEKSKETTPMSGEEQYSEGMVDKGGAKKAAEDKAAKIERLRSGFRICKPQGTFLWPTSFVSPQVVVQVDDHLVVVPTPPSASSSTTSPPQLVPIAPHPQMPNPGSPVKPVAERRAVSTATLSYVTGPLQTHPAAPLPPGTPQSNTSTNTSLFNLNEAPLTQSNNTPSYETLTHQRNHLLSAESKHGGEREGLTGTAVEQMQQQKEHSSSSSPGLPVGEWWQLALKSAKT